MNTEDIIMTLQVLKRNASSQSDRDVVSSAIDKLKEEELLSMPPLNEEEARMPSKPSQIISYRRRTRCSLAAARAVVDKFAKGEH